MFAFSVHLVAAKDRALNGRRGKFNTVSLCGKVRRRDTELYPVEPVIFILAVGFLRSEANSHGGTSVFAGGDHDTVFINDGSREVGSN